jgi:putative sterol carrier protein
MKLKFPSDEWIKELSRLLNASESYERSAKDWEGDFLFICEGDEAFPGTAHMYLDLFHGKSPKAMQLAEGEQVMAKYTLAAPYSAWRKVVEGKLDPIQGMMTKKLKLQGELMQIMRYPKAAKEIVACCALIPTDFGS